MAPPQLFQQQVFRIYDLAYMRCMIAIWVIILKLFDITIRTTGSAARFTPRRSLLRFLRLTVSSAPCSVFIMIVQTNFMELLDDSFLFHILRALDLTYISLFYSVYPDLSCVRLFLLGLLPCVFALCCRSLRLGGFLAGLFSFLFFFVVFLVGFHLLINKVHKKMRWCFYLFMILSILILFSIFCYTTLILSLRALHCRSLILLRLIYNNSVVTFLFFRLLLWLLLVLIILFFLASATHIAIYLVNYNCLNKTEPIKILKNKPCKLEVRS